MSCNMYMEKIFFYTFMHKKLLEQFNSTHSRLNDMLIKVQYIHFGWQIFWHIFKEYHLCKLPNLSA